MRASSTRYVWYVWARWHAYTQAARVLAVYCQVNFLCGTILRSIEYLCGELFV